MIGDDLLEGLAPAWRLSPGLGSLSTPLEQARAQLLLGRPPQAEEDGQWPWAAWSLGAEGAWGVLTPFHGLVGPDRITGVPPAMLGLDEQESRALFDAIEPLFASEGVTLRWTDALAWHVGHPTLKNLPCASLDRIAHDPIQRWQSRTPLGASRLLRRLQNEAQMVLHAHPVNAARSARGALTVNSLWLSQSGDASQVSDGPTASGAREELSRQTVVAWNDAETAARAWQDAWQDAWASGRADPAPTRDTPTLVLCGRAQAQAFVPAAAIAGGAARPSSWSASWSASWSSIVSSLTARLRPTPSTPSLSQWLRDLDTDSP